MRFTEIDEKKINTLPLHHSDDCHLLMRKIIADEYLLLAEMLRALVTGDNQDLIASVVWRIGKEKICRFLMGTPYSYCVRKKRR
jgi:hypothetical protein